MLRQQDCPGGHFQYDWPPAEFPWFQGSWFDGIPAYGEDGSEIFYGADLVEKIVTCRTYQELGSHTFTHIFVGEAGCSEATAKARFRIAKSWLATTVGR